MDGSWHPSKGGKPSRGTRADQRRSRTQRAAEAAAARRRRSGAGSGKPRRPK